MRDAFARTLTKNLTKNKSLYLMIGDTGSGLFDEIEKKDLINSLMLVLLKPTWSPLRAVYRRTVLTFLYML